VPRPPYISGDTSQSALNPQELIERVRRASQLAARALAHTAALVAPGVTTNALDAAAHDFLCDYGAYPSPLGYRGFPKSICTSKNEVICHGIPDDIELAEGDIVNIDVTAYLDGVHGDTSATFAAGEIDDESRLLLERTREALVRGVGAVAPGRSLRVIGTVIEAFANRFGYGVVRDFTGHGIGQDFHTGLIVPHYDDPDLDVVMQLGMVFTIEPMLTLGTIEYELAADGWTVTTADNKRSAQFEHTVAVTDTGVDVLSALP
jgi:methionyl aminopeptidase